MNQPQVTGDKRVNLFLAGFRSSIDFDRLLKFTATNIHLSNATILAISVSIIWLIIALYLEALFGLNSDSANTLLVMIFKSFIRLPMLGISGYISNLWSKNAMPVIPATKQETDLVTDSIRTVIRIAETSILTSTVSLICYVLDVLPLKFITFPIHVILMSIFYSTYLYSYKIPKSWTIDEISLYVNNYFYFFVGFGLLPGLLDALFSALTFTYAMIPLYPLFAITAIVSVDPHRVPSDYSFSRHNCPGPCQLPSFEEATREASLEETTNYIPIYSIGRRIITSIDSKLPSSFRVLEDVKSE